MNLETVSGIYTSFTAGKTSHSDLIYYLSRYDLSHEMTSDDFKKRLRLHRTIVTEINRYNDLPQKKKKETFPILAECYIKDYLYHCAANLLFFSECNFEAYVHTLIDTHTIIKKQYEQLKNRENFWRTVMKIRESMQNA